MAFDPIARIRRFNRAVTAAAGALDTSFLGRGRPLGSARVLWSIGAGGTDVADLRAILRLDAGLLSRLLRGLETEGLVTTTQRAKGDRRHRIAHLTDAGHAEKRAYDRLNDAMAADMLSGLTRNQGELIAAMDLIANTLNRDRIVILADDPATPAAKACLSAYFDLLADRIPGVSKSHVPDPDPEADAFRPPRGAFLLAWSDGVPVGCVCLKPAGDHAGEVKRLWIDASARGLGLGRRMMGAIEDAARALGHRHLRLDTNEGLTEAIALYRATGWHEIAPFTPRGPATHWFGKSL